MLTSAPTLVFYDPKKPTTVSADASSYGLGAVLLQEHGEDLKPVAYCSRSLTSAEKGYAQIEKECLAGVWACERFQRYLIGLESFTLQTDHKPLVPIMNRKDLSETPIRCQRMLLRLMRFNCTAVYTPGKNMEVADTLSRSPTPNVESQDQEELIQLHVNSIQAGWPASDDFLDMIRVKSREDVNIKAALDYTTSGWPTHKEDVILAARDMYAIRGELSVVDGLLIYGDRIVIPYSLRKKVLSLIHQGHQGIVKCRERAKASVWWPRIGKDIQDLVASCRRCLEKQPTQNREPLLPSTPPERPFQRVGVDIMEVNGNHYLVSVDYYSRYLDIAHLPRLTSQAVISKLKSCFAHHGIPETVVSDNGTQFSSTDFKQFTAEWNFHHVTSSPHYPQSNGQAESGVKVAKAIITQEDPFLALLIYRSTPLPSLGSSPAELAFGRKLRTTLPALPKTLMPRTISPAMVRERDIAAKARQKEHYDRHHGVQPLSKLHPGDSVLLKKDGEKGWREPAEVIRQIAPRSYLLQTPRGNQLRRNRKHVRPCGTANDNPAVPSSLLMPLPAPANASAAASNHRAHTHTTHTRPTHTSQPSSDQSQLTAEPAAQHPAATDHPPSQPSDGYRTRCGRAVVLPAKYRD